MDRLENTVGRLENSIESLRDLITKGFDKVEEELSNIKQLPTIKKELEAKNNN